MPSLSVVLKQKKNGKNQSANKQAAEERNYGYPPTVLSHCCCFVFALEPFRSVKTTAHSLRTLGRLFCELLPTLLASAPRCTNAWVCIWSC